MNGEDRSTATMVHVLQAMTPATRLETAFYLARLARQMMLAQAAQDHPEWTAAQLNRHVAERILRGAE
jgi:Rv0078B-related antitoxin